MENDIIAQFYLKVDIKRVSVRVGIIVHRLLTVRLLRFSLLILSLVDKQTKRYYLQLHSRSTSWAISIILTILLTFLQISTHPTNSKYIHRLYLLHLFFGNYLPPARIKMYRTFCVARQLVGAVTFQFCEHCFSMVRGVPFALAFQKCLLRARFLQFSHSAPNTF